MSTLPFLSVINKNFLSNFRVPLEGVTCTVTAGITLPVPDASSAKLLVQIQELITKPGTRPLRKSEVEKQNQVECEVSSCNYENPNDPHYCSNNAMEGVDENDAGTGIPNDSDAGNDQEEIAAEGEQSLLGENLIDLPELIPKTYFAYSQKIDMKKLKSAIWQALTREKFNIKQEDNKRDGKVIPIKFSTLYKGLPDLLTEKMQKELSCPLAVVALLDLCNEQNLKLIQFPGSSDFEILGPSSNT